MSTEEKIEEIATPAAMEAELKEAQKAVVEDKLSIGKEKKAAADELFKTGETKKGIYFARSQTVCWYAELLCGMG